MLLLTHHTDRLCTVAAASLSSPCASHKHWATNIPQKLSLSRSAASTGAARTVTALCSAGAAPHPAAVVPMLMLHPFRYWCGFGGA
jgi:hypothetical protein